MAYIPDQQINTGNFVTTTQVWDVSRLYEVDIQSPEFKELLVRLYQQINNIALSLNLKDTGYYLLEEFVTSGQLFNATSNDPLQNRPIFRRTVNMGALPAGVTTVAHGLTITAAWRFIKILGAASDTVGFNYYPLPFASAGGATNIEVRVTATNVVVTNNSGIAFTNAIVILEYVK